MAMYVPPDHWSVSEEGDPPPCFRQGDIVKLTWFRPDVTMADGGATVRLSALEARTEIVALLSACCDLVIRNPPKRKSFLLSPLRSVPKNIAKNPQLLEAVRATAKEATEASIDVPANLFYFEATEGVTESVVFLEAVASVEFPLLKSATKLAELTDAARVELQERVKFHFTRVEKKQGE